MNAEFCFEIEFTTASFDKEAEGGGVSWHVNSTLRPGVESFVKKLDAEGNCELRRQIY